MKLIRERIYDFISCFEIIFRIENFAIEGSYQCHFGFVEAFEGNMVNVSKTFGKICGNLTNRFRVIKSRTNQMVLTFYTEGMFKPHSKFSAVVSFTYGKLGILL